MFNTQRNILSYVLFTCVLLTSFFGACRVAFIPHLYLIVVTLTYLSYFLAGAITEFWNLSRGPNKNIF